MTQKNKIPSKRKKDAIVNDDRFKHMHVDPRFIPIHTKTKVSDPRLHKLFKKEFEIVQSSSKNQDTLKKQLLDEMYEFRNEGERIRVDDMMETFGTTEDSSEEDDVLLKTVKDRNEHTANLKLAQLEDEDEEDEELNEELLEMDEEMEEAMREQMEVIPTLASGEETNRLSIMNFDWKIIKTPDIFTIVNSFCPPNGKILKVSIYLSNYGEERLKNEEISGPGEVFLSEEEFNMKMEEKKKFLIEKQKQKEDRLVIREDRKKKAKRRLKDLENEEPTEEDYLNLEKVREYEMQKLKYYFAVVECDSVSTAIKIYQDLDGFEVETTGTVLDLRFIPDDVTFNDRPTLDQPLKKLPKSYQAKKNITNITLRTSSSRLTWDEDEPTRISTLNRKDFTDVDYHTLNQFLASESDSEISEEDVKLSKKERKKLYKKLANAGNSKSNSTIESIEESGEDEQNEDQNEGITISFDTDLEKQAKDLLRNQKEKKRKENETPWETKERQRKELKKKEKRERKKLFKKKEVDALEKMAQGPDEEVTNQLKGLVENPLDPNSNMKGFNIQRDLNREMTRRKQKKEIKDDTEFTVDLSDSRFRDRLLADPEFTLDPTNKKFKRDSNFEKIIEEKEQFRKRKREDKINKLSKRKKQ